MWYHLQEGDVWPNSQAEISVIFQPEGATRYAAPPCSLSFIPQPFCVSSAPLSHFFSSTSYSRVAYCDVTGRESRLPLKIRGEGIGPQLQLSFDTLDIQNVFVNSSHAYEVGLRTHSSNLPPNPTL